jgi:hypothetical protein
MYNNITGISRNGANARNEHLMVFGHDLSKICDVPLVLKHSDGREETTSQRAEIARVCQTTPGWAKLWTLPPLPPGAETDSDSEDEDGEGEAGGAAAATADGNSEAAKPLYARLESKSRLVLMWKEHPKFVPIGRRQDTVTAPGKTKEMKISEAVKRVVGFACCNTEFFKSDEMDRVDPIPLLPPDFKTEEGFGKTASRGWGSRYTSTQPRYESYPYAKAAPHSANGDDANLRPQPNPDGNHDAMAVPREGRAYRAAVQQYNEGVYNSDADHGIKNPIMNADCFLFVAKSNGAGCAMTQENMRKATAADVVKAKQLSTELAKTVKISTAFSAAQVYRHMRMRAMLSETEDVEDDIVAEVAHEHSQVTKFALGTTPEHQERKARFALIARESVAHQQHEERQLNVAADEDLIDLKVGHVKAGEHACKVATCRFCTLFPDASMAGTVVAVKAGPVASCFEIKIDNCVGTSPGLPATGTFEVNAVELQRLVLTSSDAELVCRTLAYSNALQLHCYPNALVGARVELVDKTGTWHCGTVTRFLDGQSKEHVQCDRCNRWHALPQDRSVTAADLGGEDEDWFCEDNSWGEDADRKCEVHIARNNETLKRIATRYQPQGRPGYGSELLAFNTQIAGLSVTAKLRAGTRIYLTESAAEQMAPFVPPSYQSCDMVDGKTLGSEKKTGGHTVSLYTDYIRMQKKAWIKRGKYRARAATTKARPGPEKVVPRWRLSWEEDEDDFAGGYESVDPLELEALLVDAYKRWTLRGTAQYAQYRQK